MSLFDDDDDDENFDNADGWNSQSGEFEAPCELCGDDYPQSSLSECETCSWLMCESCEGEQGNCMDCSRELGLIKDDE